jgi:mono/diheme cytochrome c family protein
MRIRFGVVLVCVAACGFAILRAAEPPARIAVPALVEMEETAAPGLKLMIEAGGLTDARSARLVSLRVNADSPPSPMLPPGPFKATWDGVITQRIKGDYTFSAIGRGTFKVTINDQVAVHVTGDDFAGKPGPVVQLKKGKNAIHAEYVSPKEGDAVVRLIWSAREFIPETVPPTLFTHDASDKPLRGQMRLRRGRELVANLRCLKCHTSDVQSAGGAMRELAADTPSLLDIGQRRSQAWLAHWINNPHAMRPDTEMPRVFHASGESLSQEARDIASYLIESSAKAQATDEKGSADDANAGARLFTGLGCVGCHVAPGIETPQETPTIRVSLKFVKSKFQPGALKEFLLKPEQHYQWIRMPNFRLTDGEATALSAFLRSRPTAELSGDTSGDAARGKQLFQSSGCISCHSSKTENLFKVAPLAELLEKSDWQRGCVAKDDAARGKAPNYELTDDSRDAIVALASTQFASLKQDTTAEFAERQMAALNCLACHPRDRQDDTWSGLKAEIDTLMKDVPPEQEKGESAIMGDQTRPPLTWAGEKLRPQWAADFINGTLKYKPRPWLAARMPGFPARAKALAQGLAFAHGCPPAAPANAKPDPQLVPIGQKLVGKVGGFSCVQCHGVREQKAFAPFEAPAINFAHVSDRLTREFYDRWVYNPQRVQPGTRMPSFADLEGKTALKDVLEGDAKKQFDAVWNYLLTGKQIEPPS